MKVAIYSGSIPTTTFIEVLIKGLADSGHQIYLFGSCQGNVKYANTSIKIFGYPENKPALHFWILWNRIVLRIKNPTSYKILSEHIEAEGNNGKQRSALWKKYVKVFLHPPDIFHVQWAKSAGEWLILKKAFNVKLVLSLRGAQINYSPLADKKLEADYKVIFPQYDAFHAVSEAIGTEAKHYGAEPMKTSVVYSGVDVNGMSVYQKQSWRNPGSDQLIIISVGRFHWKKGYHYALEAVRRLKESGTDVKYHIVAGGEAEEILYLIDELKLNNNVVLHGRKTQKEVFELMRNADCLLLSSVEEGIANVVLEAMAIRLPVISSDCGGMSEVVIDSSTGLIFRNRDVDQLVDKLKCFLHMDAAAQEKMTQSAEVLVSEKFNADDIGNRMSAVYQKVIS
jgi:glycosyltransferase involved in cell wall biosynthesis